MFNRILSNFPKKDKKKVNRDLQLAIDTIMSILGVVMLVLIIVFVTTVFPNKEEELPEVKAEPIVLEEEKVIVAQTEITEEKEPTLSDDDIMAMVVMAESGNQDMLGKVAVATTILNRCDMWGQEVEYVVTRPHQYSYPYKGEVTEDCYRAVEIARENRDLFDRRMVYFRTLHYHTFGEPYMQIQDHYFSLEVDTEIETAEVER